MIRRVRNGIFATSLALTAALAGTSACSAKKNTELVVSVTTDLRVPKDLNAVTVRVISSGAVRMENTYEVGPSGLHLPATIGIVPNDENNLTPIDVELIGGFSASKIDIQPGEERVLRKVRLTFAKNRVGLVRLPLRFACYEKTDCDKSTETCIAGQCVPTPSIEGATLPEYTAEQVFGAGGSDDKIGACWNAEACIAAAQPIVAAGDACTWSVGATSTDVDGGVLGGSDASATPPDSAPAADDAGFSPDAGKFAFKSFNAASLSVVLTRTVPNGVGFCSGETCSIPLDQDPDEGWDWTDASHTTIKLAQGLCSKVLTEGWIVQATDACATKTASVPFCDETTGGGDGGVSADTAPPGCPEGMSTCGGVCTDITRDPGNCGACGNKCASGMCSGSTCSALPDGGVTDTSIGDGGGPDNCGASSGPPATTDALLDGFRFQMPSLGANMVAGQPSLTPVEVTSATPGDAATCPISSVTLNGSYQSFNGNLPNINKPMNSLTVSIWANFDTKPPANAVLVDSGGFSIAADSTGTKILAQMAFNTGGVANITAPMPTGGWHEIVLQWKGTGSVAQLWIDAVPTPAGGGATFTAVMSTGSIGVGVAAPGASGGVLWAGNIGDLRIYGK